MTPTGPGATVEQVLAAAPPVRREPGAREQIRAMNVAAGRRIAVLDDDPTATESQVDAAKLPAVLDKITEDAAENCDLTLPS